MQYVVRDGIVYNNLSCEGWGTECEGRTLEGPTNEFAVLYSGAYKYKWNNVSKKHMMTTLFYTPLILYLLEGGNPRDLVNEKSDGLTPKGKDIIGNLFKKLGKTPYSYEDVKFIKIAWIKVGKKIRVTECDGYEKIECYDELDWIMPSVSSNL